ncbi:hypothetical protein ACI65C_010738 [Semiaphis heraclei]
MAGRGRNSSKKSKRPHTPPSIPSDKTPKKVCLSASPPVLTTGKQRSAPTSPEYEDSESLSGASYDSYITTPCSSLHSRSQTPIANQQTNPADQNSQVENNVSTAPNTILPPPFFLTIKPDHPWKTIAKELFSIKGHENVTAKTTTKPQEIKLNCHDEKTFRSVQSFLSSIQEKVGYHTHALPTQRNLKIVIKGLPLDLTNEEITEELTNLGYKPIFIRAFIKNEKRLPIHQNRHKNAQTPTQKTISSTQSCQSSQNSLTFKMNDINILFWNCDGIQHKLNELNTFSKQNNIHIILLQETRINHNTPFKLPNYFTYRQDRPPKPRTPPSGGTAILVRKNIVHSHDPLQTAMDSTSITIQLGNDNVRISSLYKSPKMPLQLTDLEAITNQKLKFIAAGDLNAKHPTWNSRTTNTSGNLLQNHMESSNSYTICAPVSPTHHSYNPKHAPEVLDIVISNLNDRDFTLNNHNDLSSDHNPIILSISDSITSLNPPKARKRINWKKFEKYLSENLSKINNIKSTEDIDKEISTLTKTIQSALEINSYTYLGITFDKLLTFNTHIKETIQRAKRTRAILYPVINHKSPIPMATRLSMYKIYIRPVILYAISAWGAMLSKSNWRQVEAVQNIALRVITGTHYLTSNNTLLLTTKIPSLYEETIRTTKVFFYRNSVSKYAHIRGIGVLPSEEITPRRNRPFTLTQY